MITMVHIVLLTLFSLLTYPTLCSSQAAHPTFRIAVIFHILNDNTSFTLTDPLPNNPFYQEFSTSVGPMLYATRMWASLLNQAGGIPLWDTSNTRIPVEIIELNVGPTKCVNEPDQACMIRPRQLAAMLANSTGPFGRIDGVVPPGFSSEGIVAEFLNVCDTSKQCIAVAPLTPGTSPFVCQAPLPRDCIDRRLREGSRRFQFGYSVLYDGSFAMSSPLTLYRQQGIMRMAIVASNLTYGIQAAATTQDTILSLGMTAADTWFLAKPITMDVAIERVQMWIREGVKGVCLLSNGADAIAVDNMALVVKAWKALDWMPSAVAVGGSIFTKLGTKLSTDELAYWMTTSQWDWHLKGRAYTAVNTSFNLELYPANGIQASPAVFRDALMNYTGIKYLDDALVYAVDATQALNFMLKFAENAGSTQTELMRAGSRSVSSPTVVGQLQLDAFGRTIVSDQLVFQSLVNGTRLILSPLSIGTAGVLPIPKWSERAFAGDVVESSVEKAATITGALCCAITVLLMIGFVRYRSHAVIKAATPVFCILVTFGALLMLTSVFGTGLYVTDDGCAAQFWLLTLGFSLMFTALFAKTFRIWRIFHHAQKLRQIRITNTDLMLQLGVVISFDVILNVVWMAVAPPSAKYVVVDSYRPADNYYTCDLSGTSATFALISIAEKGALLVGGIVLTYLCRGVPSKFNETPYLAAAIYNCGLLSTFIVALVGTGIGGRTVTYAVQVWGVQLAVLSTLAILFLPKFNLILFDKEKLKQFGNQATDEILVDKPKAGTKAVDFQHRHNGQSTTPKTKSNNGSDHSAPITPIHANQKPSPGNRNLRIAPSPHTTQHMLTAIVAARTSGSVPGTAFQRPLILDVGALDDASLLQTQKEYMNTKLKLEADIARLIAEIESRKQQQNTDRGDPVSHHPADVELIAQPDLITEKERSIQKNSVEKSVRNSVDKPEHNLIGTVHSYSHST